MLWEDCLTIPAGSIVRFFAGGSYDMIIASPSSFSSISISSSSSSRLSGIGEGILLTVVCLPVGTVSAFLGEVADLAGDYDLF